MKKEEIVQLDPDILGGMPVFSGTRVPIKSLFEHLEGGDSIDDFLEGFPSVRRDQVMISLKIYSQSKSKNSLFVNPACLIVD